jgi:hypothetical protein
MGKGRHEATLLEEVLTKNRGISFTTSSNKETREGEGDAEERLRQSKKMSTLFRTDDERRKCCRFHCEVI